MQPIKENNGKMRSIKKRILRNKVENHLLGSFRKSVSTQTKKLVFTANWNQARSSKFESYLIYVLDYFVDGHDFFATKLASFRKVSI